MTYYKLTLSQILDLRDYVKSDRSDYNYISKLIAEKTEGNWLEVKFLPQFKYPQQQYFIVNSDFLGYVALTRFLKQYPLTEDEYKKYNEEQFKLEQQVEKELKLEKENDNKEDEIHKDANQVSSIVASVFIVVIAIVVITGFMIGKGV